MVGWQREETSLTMGRKDQLGSQGNELQKGTGPRSTRQQNVKIWKATGSYSGFLSEGRAQSKHFFRKIDLA